MDTSNPVKETLGSWSRAVRAIVSKSELAIRGFGNRVIDSYPRFREPITRLWEAYIVTYVGFRTWSYSFRYARRTSLDPFAVVSVDPDRIEYIVERDGYPAQTRDHTVFPTPKFKHAGGVLTGDWDDSRRRFEDTDIYRAFEARFERGVPWRETDFYRRTVEFIERGVEMWGCTSEREFERRCAFVERLYETIEKRGYRSQAELREASFDPPGGSHSSTIVGLVNDEVTVCVGRDGRLLFVDGRNRLALAKVLDLDSIPVWILVRHEEWQRFRERLAGDPSRCGELPPRLRTHPDLCDICGRRDSD